jgi:hypothetical protein
MTTLALVDLDNIFGTLGDGSERGPWVPVRDRAGFRWTHDDGSDVTAERVGDRSRCVVVLAANTVTFVRQDLDAPFLARFARRVARVLGHVDPSAILREIAMTLPTPQAADRALLQLLARASSTAGALQFDAVAVFTEDRGLRQAISRRLGPRWSTRGPDLRRPMLTEFNLPRGWTRRFAEPEVPQATPVTPDRGSNVVWLDTPAACAWAVTQPVQRRATLAETAREAECHAACLTQLSLTLASFRGAARLTNGTSNIEACSPADGVELAVPVAQETRCGHGVAQSSPLGAGAVRIRGAYATVRTSLPPAWVVGRTVASHAILGPTVNRIVDAELLANAPACTPAGFTVRVRIASRRAQPPRPAALVAEVVPDLAFQVQGWWTTNGARRPRSHCEVAGAEHLTSAPLETVAQQAVLADGARRELIVMASPVHHVTLTASCSRGMLGAADASGLPFAVLALDNDLGAGETAVQPIQALSADDLAMRCPTAGLTVEAWAALRRLPVLIAASADRPVRQPPVVSSGE